MPKETEKERLREEAQKAKDELTAILADGKQTYGMGARSEQELLEAADLGGNTQANTQKTAYPFYATLSIVLTTQLLSMAVNILTALAAHQDKNTPEGILPFAVTNTVLNFVNSIFAVRKIQLAYQHKKEPENFGHYNHASMLIGTMCNIVFPILYLGVTSNNPYPELSKLNLHASFKTALALSALNSFINAASTLFYGANACIKPPSLSR